MVSFLTVLMKLFSVFAAHILLLNCVNGSIGRNLNAINVVKNSWPGYARNLSEFIYTISTSSALVDSPRESKPKQVDCLGLGTTFAAALEWFFMNKPNGTDALDVKFLLSSRDQPRRVQVIIGKQFGLEWTDFRVHRPTIIIVHGFLSHGRESWINDLEKSFLQWGDVNVMVVDWSSGGNTWNYYKAAVNTRIVGYQIARFLEHIENATDAGRFPQRNNLGPLHLVGHSLGAHICGCAAKELKKRRSKWRVQRITGLDPAQPCFKNADPAVKLHKSDALFVDIIHTNGKLLSRMGLGLPDPIGHTDFYPNGGKSQPGCAKIDTSYYRYLPLPVRAISNSICSHGRSYIYLIESLVSDIKHNCTFWAHPWDLSYRNLIAMETEHCTRNFCTEMGINAINYPQRGTFFVATSNSIPFCLNDTNALRGIEAVAQMEKDNESEIYRYLSLN